MAPQTMQHARDDSGAGNYSPVVIFFSLLALCLVIMAPLFWMMWLMRNDNRNGE